MFIQALEGRWADGWMGRWVDGLSGMIVIIIFDVIISK